MTEWLKMAAIARRAGYSVAGVQTMMHNGAIPREYIARNGKGYMLDSSVVPWLIEHKQEWHSAIKQPDDSIHIPDPLGIQAGLWLAPDAARRLLAIRRNKRVYGDNWACNRQLVNALMTVREFIGDG